MSFGMGKRLKYLKIRGQLLRTGEPEVDDPDVRVYRAVTLKDDDAGGQEVHFRVMFIPRRLEDALEANGWCGTFYVLRHLDGQGLVGALYAAEVNGQKVYEPTGGWKAMKFMTAVSSRRLQIVASNPAVLTFVFLVGLLPIWMLCALLLPGGLSFIGTLVGGAVYGYWLTLPMFRARTYLAFNDAEEQLKAAGFNVSPVLSNKY